MRHGSVLNRRGRGARHFSAAVIALPALVGVAMLVAPPRAAWANAGVPSFGGVPVGEVGGLAGIRIVSETLAIDLRPVDSSTAVAGASDDFGDDSRRLVDLGSSAIVTATYFLANDGEGRIVDLHFAHGVERVQDFRVAIDDRPVTARRLDLDLQPEWRPPLYSPGPDGPESYLFSGMFGDDTISPSPSTFHASLPPGPSRLTVRYRAVAGTYLVEPLIVRQFAYILAPARSWAGFGTLDVAVEVPPGWRAWSEPALERRGDRLTAHFEGVPADALTLSVQPAEGAWRIAARWLSRALLAFVLIAGARLCWRIGRRRGMRPWPRRVMISVVNGVAWGAAVAVAGWLVVTAPDAVTPFAHLTNYGYGKAMAFIVIAVLAVVAAVLGMIVTWIADGWAWPRDPTWPASDSPQTPQPPATGPR